MKGLNDDYLWEGSGEPDPEIEQIEQLLRAYRYKPQTAPPVARPGGSPWMKLAVAAAVALFALAAFWAALNRNSGSDASLQAGAQETQSPGRDDRPANAAPQAINPAGDGVAEAPLKKANATAQQVTRPLHARRTPRAEESRVPDVPAIEEYEGVDSLAYFYGETMDHIGRAQIVLRSFSNTAAATTEAAEDVAYERERSRNLLYRNIRLRRDAVARGDHPAEELLSDLETFLLDIANLPDIPAPEDLRSIQDRMQKREIVATLQIYSAQAINSND